MAKVTCIMTQQSVGANQVIPITYDEYQELSNEQKLEDILYIITDRNEGNVGGGSGGGNESGLKSIEVTTLPAKTNYVFGESFDPTGMIVKAKYYSTNEIVEIENYSYSPNRPLTDSDDKITIYYIEDSVLESTTIDISVALPIYGVSWDGSSTTKWTRTDVAATFVDPVPSVGGSVGSSPFDTIMPWAGMTVSERDGGTMVAIPKFWYKLEQNGNGMSIQISNIELEGFHVSPAHMTRSDGKGERDIVYIGRYHCDENNWKSQTGTKPKINITRATARDNIHNLGSTIWQVDYATRFTLWLLYLVEFADWNSQNTIGYGCCETNEYHYGVFNNGKTDNMPYHTGTVSNSRNHYGACQYRNIEGLWDNCHDWLDGCYYRSGHDLYIAITPNRFPDGENGSGGYIVGTCHQSGYPSKFNVTKSGFFPTFFPTIAGGSDNTYSCDQWNTQDSNIFVCIYTGAEFRQYFTTGLFYMASATASATGDAIGARLMELP